MCYKITSLISRCLTFSSLFLFFLLFLGMQLQFDLVTHLSHTDHTSAVYPAQTHCWPRLSYSTNLTHTLLRHSLVVWPVTTRQLFLLSCHISHDVRALLCVIGWRLCAPCVCGRYDVGGCCSLGHRESWSKWSTDVWPHPIVEHLHLSCYRTVKMCNICVTEASSKLLDFAVISFAVLLLYISTGIYYKTHHKTP